MKLNPITYNDSTTSVNIDLSRFSNGLTTAQHEIDLAVLKNCRPFVPFKNGGLIKSGDLATLPNLGKGEVVYDQVYARRQYYGVDFNFNTSKNPQAQAYWFEAAKSAHKNEWLEIAKAYGGGNK